MKTLIYFKDQFIALFLVWKFLFTKDFIRKSYDRHFLYTYFIIYYMFRLFYYFGMMEGVKWYYWIIIGTLVAWGINFLKEGYSEVVNKIPNDFNDVRFGVNAGIISSIISYLTLIH